MVGPKFRHNGSKLEGLRRTEGRPERFWGSAGVGGGTALGVLIPGPPAPPRHPVPRYILRNGPLELVIHEWHGGYALQYALSVK